MDSKVKFCTTNESIPLHEMLLKNNYKINSWNLFNRIYILLWSPQENCT